MVEYIVRAKKWFCRVYMSYLRQTDSTQDFPFECAKGGGGSLFYSVILFSDTLNVIYNRTTGPIKSL